MLDVGRSPELQAAILGMRQAATELRRDINKDTRQQLAPVWAEAIRSRARTRTDQAILVPGAKVAARANQLGVKAATRRRPLSGGLVPADEWQGFEFGATPKKRTFTARSPKGTRYKVTRTVNAGRPRRVQHGRVVFPAASEVGTRLVGLWVVTIVDQFKQFSEIKGSSR